jgi:molybdenum cofactor biosynthesis enzyme
MNYDISLRSERAIVLKNSSSHFWACLLTLFLSSWANADDTDAPTLNAISIDKVTVDVTEESQTITITVDASDESGVDWENRYSLDRTQLWFRDPGGTYHYALGNNENPGILTLTIDNSDVGGEWQVGRLTLVDVNGNAKDFSNLSEYDFPDSIEVLGGAEADPPSLSAISIDKVTVDVTEESQTITITVDASDESGVDWENRYSLDRTQLWFRDPGGTYHYALGNNENPGILTLTIDNSDVGGEWQVGRLTLVDVNGNAKDFSNLSEYDFPDSIEVLGGAEADPPSLSAISIDKVTVDVTEESQTITITVDASDESGVDWENRYSLDRTQLWFRDPGGTYHYALGNNENPGILTLTIDNSDVGGEWQVGRLTLVDVNGNAKDFSNLTAYGLPDYLYVLKTDEPTSNISLSYTGLYEILGETYDYEMVVTAENLASEATTSLDLSISTRNLRVTSVRRENGSQACSLASSNYDSTVSCATSEIPANSSAVFRVSVTAGVTGSSWLNLNLLGETPDITLRDNYIYLSSTIQEEADSDGDGTPDNIDAFPLDPTETTDTDGDGIGNNADIDDDGDGTNDSEDAFPLDATEALDTDDDGIGNNADIDDDGDGFSDAYESANGSDPLDANSVPSVSEEETGGLPIWMIYLGTQMAEQNPEPPEEPVNDEPVDPPLLE